MFIAVTIGLCLAIKVLSALEWPPLFRVFLLVPATVLGFFSGSDYSEHRGVYTFPGFILDYSCSGIHFFMIAALLAVVVLPRNWLGFITGIGAAYLVTLAANTARVGLFLKVMPLSAGRPWLHEVIGTCAFVSFLLIFYGIMRWRDICSKHNDT